MEGMRKIPCPENNEGCKYAPDCISNSVHHVYPRRLVRALEKDPSVSEDEARIAKRFINLPINKVVSCRMIHDYLDTVSHTELPSTERMERALDE